MASFRAHFSLGIASGILVAIGLVSLALFEAPSFLMVVFIAAVLGSVLPDMDSDSGIPFHVSFGSLSLVVAVLVGLSVYAETPNDPFRILLFSAGAFGGVYFVIGWMFKRFTRHRGMAHSLPVAFLAGLVTFFLAGHLSFPDDQAFTIGVAMTLGYVGHLILDELYAAVNFHGRPFVPNKALGSALKLASDNTVVNVGVFGAILFLVAGNVGRLANLSEQFWDSIQTLWS